MFFMFRIHSGAVKLVKINVFHVPDTFGDRLANKNPMFFMFRINLGAVWQVRMNVFHVPDTFGGRLAGKNECFSCSGYMWGPVCK